MRFFLFLAAAGSVLGALMLLGGLFGSKSAVQESAAAAYACAFAVIPYVLARANMLWTQRDVEERRHQEVLKALRRDEAQAPAPQSGEDAPAGPVHVALAKRACPQCGALNLVSAIRCSNCPAILGPTSSAQ